MYRFAVLFLTLVCAGCGKSQFEKLEMTIRADGKERTFELSVVKPIELRKKVEDLVVEAFLNSGKDVSTISFNYRKVGVKSHEFENGTVIRIPIETTFVFGPKQIVLRDDGRFGLHDSKVATSDQGSFDSAEALSEYVARQIVVRLENRLDDSKRP